MNRGVMALLLMSESLSVGLQIEAVRVMLGRWCSLEMVLILTACGAFRKSKHAAASSTPRLAA